MSGLLGTLLASGTTSGPSWVLVAAALACAAGAVALVVRSRAPHGGAATQRIAPWVRTATPGVPVASEAPDDVPSDGRRAALAETLRLADLTVSADAFLARVGGGALTLAVLLAITVAPVAALAPIVLVPLLARAYVQRRIRRRRRRFADQLGETVQSIAGAMRAGHGLSAGLAMVADDAPEPMATELHRVVAAQRLGVALEDALTETVRRTGNRDLEKLALVAALQRDVGGNGAEALDLIVETIRARDDLRRLVTTLTAQGELSRWVLTALPVGLAAIILVINPTFFAPMWREGLGKALVAMAAAMVAAGSMWIRRIVSIEV